MSTIKFVRGGKSKKGPARVSEEQLRMYEDARRRLGGGNKSFRPGPQKRTEESGEVVVEIDRSFGRLFELISELREGLSQPTLKLVKDEDPP